MPRRMLAPINSVKHYVQRATANIVSGTRVGVVLSDAVVAPATSTTADVREGAIIKAMYLEFWVKGTGASDAFTQFIGVLEKAPGDQVGVTFTDMTNMSSYDNKKNVLYMTQGVIGGIGGGQSVPIVRQWFKIPKGKQRQGKGDAIIFSIASIGTTAQHCGFTTYKEYV